MPRTMNLAERVRKLREFVRRERRLPSYAEMLKLFRLRSKNTIFALIAKLVEAGYIKKSPQGKLAPTGKLNGSVRMLGAVAAGFPSPAEEELHDTLNLDEFLIRRPEATFMLTVTGDSMIEAGIQPGDIVLVERGVTPKDGNIVVANVDDEWTLKYYSKDKEGVRLDPANKKYPTIRPKRSLELGGVVKAVIRKYVQRSCCMDAKGQAAAQPFTLHSFPHAIVHFDGDAFFTSVEQALHPNLKGRPVVTGQERGIIACASYEAKALGIKRGVALHEARRMCPDLVVLPSDYETYSLFSKRMFDIARRFSPMVEEYSIDEGFADLTGLRRIFHTSYEDIARQLQQTIGAELGMTVSVGLSLSKSLAKLCSKYRKPRGFTAVAGYHVHLLLPKTPLEKVWGFGPNTVALLTKLGLRTAYDFAIRPEAWAEKLLGKIGRELWGELRGEMVYLVTTEEKSAQFTISKCKTFTAPSAEREFVLAKLIRNVESAFIKLRRHELRARSLVVALRKKDYSQTALEARLGRATSSTQEVVPLVTQLFEQLYTAGAEYRSTVVVLGRLEPDRERQRELFEDNLRIEKLERASVAIDAINEHFGKHTVSMGTGLFLAQHRTTERDIVPWRKTELLPGETARQRLKVPRLAVTV